MATEILFKVQAENTYFCGTVDGVKFRQATGGGMAMVPREKAVSLVKKHDFLRCEDLKNEPVLTDIKGIAKRTAEKLGEAGVESLTDLINDDAATLAKETGLPQDKIAGWQVQAADLLTDGE